MVVFALANLGHAVLFGLVATGRVLGVRSGWIFALFAAAVGYLLPGMLLARKIELRKREIREGLPDALDLFIVCVEAGCGLDQAMVKASDELGITYPALAYELRLITTEIRAGKPRVEAFKNFAARTKVDDVQSLVALLVQTDKFGTSMAAGAAHACRHVEDQAPSGCRGARRKTRCEAGVPARAVPVSGTLHRHPRTRGDHVRSRIHYVSFFRRMIHL